MTPSASLVHIRSACSVKHCGRILKHNRFFCGVIVAAVLVPFALYSFGRMPWSSQEAPCSQTTSTEMLRRTASTLRNIATTMGVTKAMDTETACEASFKGMFEHLTSTYRSCLLEKMDKKSKWQELPNVVGSCLGETLWRTLNVHLLTNWDDTKLVILPSHMDPCYKVSHQFDCVEITLGVGNDIEAEKKLRNLLPSCRFFGADPILASGQVFKEIGTYYELAVAGTAGVLEASVLENNVYQSKNVTAITFLDMITKYAKVDHVDYLFVDNEGPEYVLFEQLKPNGLIGSSNISICQISVEMHGPLQSYGMNESRFDELIQTTISQTSFLPFWSVYGGYHTRSYYLNVHDDYCLQTFYMSKFCKKHCKV